MKDGSVLSSRVEYAKGTPKNPVLPADLENKFRLCCSQKLSTRQINDVLHLLNHFEQVEDIDKLIAMIN
jgi:2-methylcitrate dehydratase PrpD